LPRTKTGPGQPQNHPPTVFFSHIEHPSITASAAEAYSRGYIVKHLLVNNNGTVEQADITHGSRLTIFGPSVVSVMLANNETGIVQPVSQFAVACHEQEALMHTDAVQAVGKIPVHFRKLSVHAMTVAPHKFHGPLGIGALVLRHGVKLQPQLFGGFQQSGLRPGTENAALAVGFHKALELAMTELADRAAAMRALRDELERLLRAELSELIIIGQNASRLPNTSCVSFPGLDRQALVMALDLAGVACSTGSACASGSSEPSPTLVAMGLAQDVIGGAIRFSLSAFTTAADVAEASRRIIKTVKHLRAGK